MGKQVRKGCERRRQDWQRDKVKAALRKAKKRGKNMKDKVREELAQEIATLETQLAQTKKVWEAEKILHKQTQELLAIQRKKNAKAYYVGLANGFLAVALVAVIIWAVLS